MKLLPRKKFSKLNNVTTKIKLKKLGWTSIPNQIESTSIYLDNLDAGLVGDPSENDGTRLKIFGKHFNKQVEQLAASIDKQDAMFKQLLGPLEKSIKDSLPFKHSMEQTESLRVLDGLESSSQALGVARRHPQVAKAIMQDIHTQERLGITDGQFEAAADIHARATLGDRDYETLTNLQESKEALREYGAILMDVYGDVNKAVTPIMDKQHKVEG